MKGSKWDRLRSLQIGLYSFTSFNTPAQIYTTRPRDWSYKSTYLSWGPQTVGFGFKCFQYRPNIISHQVNWCKLGIVYGKYVISCTPMGSNWYITRITNSKKVRGGFTANIYIYIYIDSSTTTQTLLICDAFAKQLVFRRMKNRRLSRVARKPIQIF